jgi:hypothetical protein
MGSHKLLAIAGLKTEILHISASQVARIIGMSHQHPVRIIFKRDH